MGSSPTTINVPWWSPWSGPHGARLRTFWWRRVARIRTKTKPARQRLLLRRPLPKLPQPTQLATQAYRLRLRAASPAFLAPRTRAACLPHRARLLMRDCLRLRARLRTQDFLRLRARLRTRDFLRLRARLRTRDFLQPRARLRTRDFRRPRAQHRTRDFLQPRVRLRTPGCHRLQAQHRRAAIQDCRLLPCDLHGTRGPPWSPPYGGLLYFCTCRAQTRLPGPLSGTGTPNPPVRGVFTVCAVSALV